MKHMLPFLFLLISMLLVTPCLAESDAYTPEAGYDVRRDDVTYGKLTYATYDSATTGRQRKCWVLLPADYTEEKTYPVLYLLHGIGGDHSEWLGGKPDVVIGNLTASGQAKDMIVVIPNVRARANDAGNPSDIYSPAHFAAFDNFINDLRDDLMPYIAEHYSIAAGRENTAVAGLSMGGREALYIGLTMPETFGYVGAFCPAPGVLPYNVEKGLFPTEEFKLADGYESLILINAGKTDGVVGAWPSTYASTLEKNGTKHIFYVTEGGHDFTVWKHGLYNFAKRIFQ
ncbi:MAG: esterase family protein [Clostridia bacterium]|nr:esterase family protein [Clostridia bacterium]